MYRIFLSKPKKNRSRGKDIENSSLDKSSRIVYRVHTHVPTQEKGVAWHK